MKNYQVRWFSQTIVRWPEYPGISANPAEGVITPDGRWVVVYLPTEPALTDMQEEAVRAKAAALNYNVIQLPPRPNPETQPLNNLLPWPISILRNKLVSKTFPYSVTNVPCGVTQADYRNYPNITDPAWFAKYTSSPANMGPYYIDGVKKTFSEFMGSWPA